MNKYIVTSIISVFLISAAAQADNSRLMMKSGISISDGSGFNQQNQEQAADPVKWKDDSRLSKNPPKQDAKNEDGKCYYVTSPVTNIRSTPSFLGDRIGIYKYGNYICAKSRTGEWINTGSGWVNVKFLSEKSPDTKVAAKTTEAKPQDTVKPVAIKRQAPVAAPKAEQAVAVVTPESKKTDEVASPVLKKQLIAKTQEQKKALKQFAPEQDAKKQVQKSDVAYINGDKVNIRKKPDKGSRVVGLYNKNQKVKVLETRGDWTRTKKGWVNNQFISDSKNGKTAKAEKEKVVKCMYVSYKKANIRTNPSKRASDIGDYDKGDNVCFYEIKGNWARSDKGWVSLANFSEAKCYEVITSSLKVMSKPSSSSKLIKTLSKGDQVCDYGRKYGWVNNGKGWVSGLYLK